MLCLLASDVDAVSILLHRAGAARSSSARGTWFDEVFTLRKHNREMSSAFLRDAMVFLFLKACFCPVLWDSFWLLFLGFFFGGKAFLQPKSKSSFKLKCLCL